MPTLEEVEVAEASASRRFGVPVWIYRAPDNHGPVWAAMAKYALRPPIIGCGGDVAGAISGLEESLAWWKENDLKHASL